MLDNKTFLDGLELLNLHFDKSLNVRIIPIWKEYFDKEITDDDFIQAIKEAILGCQFFPTAKQLVGFAQGGNELKAQHEWQMLILPAAAAAKMDQVVILNQLSARGRVALQLIGGIAKVAEYDEKWLEKLGKDFKTLYCQAPASSQNLLPFAKPESRTYTADSEPVTTLVAVKTISKNPRLQAITDRCERRKTGQISLEESYRVALSIEGWEIGDDRFQHFMETVSDKATFVRDLTNQVRKGKSPMVAFDKLANYTVPAVNYDPKQVAKEWLEGQEN